MSTTALGREEKVFVVQEATYGTAASAPAATDAIRVRSVDLKMKEDRQPRSDKRNTRSWLATIVRRLTAEWSLSGYLLPSGAAGTSPDGWDDVIECGMGTKTVNGGTSVVFSLAKEFSKSLTIHRAVGQASASGVAGEMSRGCVVNQLQFTLSGQDEAMISASGFAADKLRAGVTTTLTDNGTALVVASGKGPLFDAGMYINAGAATGVLISSVSSDTLTTVSHSASSVGNAVIPMVVALSQTFAAGAVPISGILGSCTLEGSSFDIISANINISNDAKAHNDKYGTNKTSDFHFGNRKVDGTISFRLTDVTFLTLAKTRRSTFIALTLVSGTTAGSIATFSLPNILIDYTDIPSTATEDMIISLPFTAYGSAGEDELTITLT